MSNKEYKVMLDEALRFAVAREHELVLKLSKHQEMRKALYDLAKKVGEDNV